jgi:2-dehydropantoate 2-reductase
MQATAQNYSSMNRDHALGKKTEISAISGYIVKLAKHHHINTPHNKLAYLKLS